MESWRGSRNRRRGGIIAAGAVVGMAGYRLYRLFGRKCVYQQEQNTNIMSTNVPKCLWPIGANQTLEFDIYNNNDGWSKNAGLYIFSYLAAGGWVALYVGQTDDFSKRPAVHDRLDEAVRLGATHIHARVVSLQADRDQQEVALIRHLQPSLNEQHK